MLKNLNNLYHFLSYKRIFNFKYLLEVIIKFRIFSTFNILVNCEGLWYYIIYFNYYTIYYIFIKIFDV